LTLTKLFNNHLIFKIMKTVSMSGSLRENVGKKDAKALRANGMVPCVIYGGEKQLHVTVKESEFKPLLFTPYTHVVEMDLDGQKLRAILQDIQYHPVKDNVLHADFLEVSEDKPVVVSLPIRTVGTSPGVLRGGKLIKKYRKLKVKGLLADLPEVIEVSIDKLDVGQGVKVGAINIENVELLDPARNMVVNVKTARGVVAAAAPEEEA